MIWLQLSPTASIDHLGYIPQFLSDDDPRCAAEQIEENYSHGGGWRPLKGWVMDDAACIRYPGDPHLSPIFASTLHVGQPNEEEIYIYPHAWVAIVAADDSYEVARLD